jgi:hypothetical protein
MVALRRQSLDGDGRERVQVDASVALLAEEKYGWLLSLLGPPSTERIASVPGDIITIQALVKGGALADEIQPHHLFVGVQDEPPQFDARPGGLLRTLNLLRATPGYLGAWPRLGFLDWLPLGEVQDYAGFSQLPLGLWRWQGSGLSVLSFQPQVLQRVVPHLRPEPSDSPAQMRLSVGDLSASQLAPWINSLNHQRARQASLGNARLLHLLTDQFCIPAESAQDEAERLLQAQLVCALGGQYEHVTAAGFSEWRSTAWGDDGRGAPDTFRAPLLNWFRGMRADVTRLDDQLLLHAELDVQRAPREGLFNLPALDRLFGGAKDEWGGGRPE